MSTPFVTVKSRFESKEKLVAAVKELATDDLWVERTNADRGGDKGLDRVSNAKLLRLHEIFSEVKKEFGTRAKLIDAILELEGRSKDEGYRARLERYTVPRLYDILRTARKAGRTKAS